MKQHSSADVGGTTDVPDPVSGIDPGFSQLQVSPTPVSGAFITDSSACRWGSATPNPSLSLSSMDSRDSDAQVEWWVEEVLEGRLDKVPWSVSTLRMPVFVDTARREALRAIIPKLHRLHNGTLQGQKSCFLLIGPRGAGKSTFLRALAAATCDLASSNTAVVYRNFKSEALVPPSVLISSALQTRETSDDQAATGSQEKTLDDLTRILRNRRLNVLIFLDEFERIYAEDNDLSRLIVRELHAIGDYSGTSAMPRRVMVIATGSAAVLRKLAFSIGGYRSLSDEYNLYGKSKVPSLNNTKFVALPLRPLYDDDELSRALLSFASSKPDFCRAAVRAGLLTPPLPHSSEGTSPTCPGASADGDCCHLLSCGWSAAHNMLPSFAIYTGGLARFFEDFPFDLESNALRIAGGARTPSSRRTVVVEVLSRRWTRASASGIPGRDVMASMYMLWEKAQKDHAVDPVVAARDFAAVRNFAASRQDFGAILKVTDGEALYHLVYEATDAQVIWYDAAADSVSFLHPSDLAVYILCELHKPTDPELSPAENLSLLCPNLPTASDLNEALVFQALAWKSSQTSGLVIDGYRFPELQVADDVLLLSKPVSKPNETSGLTVEAFSSARPCTFYKEFPDIFGADGVAHDLPNSLLRVQVKMSSRPENAPDRESRREAEKWVAKLHDHNDRLGALFRAGGTKCARRLSILWNAQPCTGPATQYLAELPMSTLVVDSRNMSQYWHDRVKKFVDAEKLTQYGFGPVPATT